MNIVDVASDARRMFDVIAKGGVGLAPADTGYGLVAASPDAADLVFKTKKRGSHKRNAIIANLETQRELLKLDSKAQNIVDTLVEHFDLPIGVLGEYDPEHPLLETFSANDDMRRKSTAASKLAMLVNAGPIHRELCKLSREYHVPIFGSSANLTGTGARFRIEDVQPEIRAIVDIEIDYGLAKYDQYKRSGTIIDFSTMEVIRMGARYDQIKDICKRMFDVDLPADPGVDVNESGHLDEFRLVGVE